jgi:hypothetical protein
MRCARFWARVVVRSGINAVRSPQRSAPAARAHPLHQRA